MKIEKTKAIREFFKRCEENLRDDRINDYLSVLIQSPEEAEEIRQELHDIGDPEFAGPKKNWPSLYLDIAQYLDRPYHANIHLDHIENKDFEYDYEDIPGDILYNFDEVKPDPKKELNDYMVLRAFDKPLKTTVLKQNGEYWMTDNPCEAITVDPSVDKAHGKVLTYGLGIGYYIYMCLLKEDVESVTVVELNESVIRMFNESLLPQFPRKDKIRIIHGNAIDYFNEEFVSQFDSVFADVWMNHIDGLMLMEKMLENYLPPLDKVDFWIEFSCTEVITSLIFQYFCAVASGEKLRTVKQYRKLALKIDKYFSKIDKTVTDENELKHYMYDRQTIREILSIRV